MDAISLLKLGLPKYTGIISMHSSLCRCSDETDLFGSEWMVLKAEATPSDSKHWHFTQIKSLRHLRPKPTGIEDQEFARPFVEANQQDDSWSVGDLPKTDVSQLLWKGKLADFEWDPLLWSKGEWKSWTAGLRVSATCATCSRQKWIRLDPVKSNRSAPPPSHASYSKVALKSMWIVRRWMGLHQPQHPQL